MKPGALLRFWFRRRFHPLTRIGWATTRTAGTNTQTMVGLSLIGAGWYLKRRTKKAHLYTHILGDGESVRITVRKGAVPLADTTIGR
ncbi:MAG: hypothetical protein R2823_07715 [Acidimicrobiia bacterium]